MVVITISIMIFTATSSVLIGLNSAPSAFAANEGFAIASSTAPTIFASQVDYSMVGPLSALPKITGASPEIFAFCSFNGVSFVMRGVDLDHLNDTGPAFKRFELSGTASVKDKHSAMVGANLKERLAVKIPYTIPVVGSYDSKIEFVNIVGTFRTGTSMDDEMLVSLDVARFLTGMSLQKVSIIRVSTSDPEWLSGLLAPEGPRFTLFDLLAQKSQAALNEEVGVSVGIRNWGSSSGEITATFYADNVTLGEKTVTLAPSESYRAMQPVTFSTLGRHTVNVSIQGMFPVTLSVNISVVEPYLRIAAPAKVALASRFTVTVTNYLGNPEHDASVTFGSQTNTTDSDGNTSFIADQVGTFSAIAHLGGYADTSASVTVVYPDTYPLTFSPVLVSFTLSPETIKESESALAVIVVANNGSLPGTFNVTVYLDTAPYTTLTVNLSAIESKTVSFRLRDVATGNHIVQIGTFSESLSVQSWIVDNPDFVQLVMRYSGSDSLFAAGSIPIYQAAKISEGNVAVALFAIGSISGLLTLLAITSVFSKEIREGRRRLGILKTIGASRSAIRRMVFPQALENSLGGAAMGIAFGVVIADVLSKSDLLVLFGHRFHVDLNLNLLLLLLLGSVAISVASALVSAMMAVRETTISSIRKLDEEVGEPIDVEKAIADE